MNLRNNLVSDRVSLLEQSALVVVPPGATAREAMALMRERRCGCVLVCEAKRLVGIFTERDVLRRVLAPRADLDVRIDVYMTPDPVTIQPGDSVGAVMRRLIEGGYRHLPVLDEHGAAVGVVSVRGLIHYFVEHFPTTVYNLPPVPGQVQSSREGA